LIDAIVRDIKQRKEIFWVLGGFISNTKANAPIFLDAGGNLMINANH